MNFERLIIGMYEFCKPIPIELLPKDYTADDLLD